MSDYGEITEAGAIRFDRLLPGPIERVWQYLTDTDKRGAWLMPGPMEPRVGGRVEFFFRHSDLTPHDEPTPEKYRNLEGDAPTSTGTVTRFEPPRGLSFTWNEATAKKEGRVPSEVAIDLTPVGDKVRLILVHRRLNDAGLRSVSGGWHTHLGLLVDKLEGRTPPPFWATHARMEAEYAARLGL
jgi:uncharacterized protein YndB with AHSA1/START domain